MRNIRRICDRDLSELSPTVETFDKQPRAAMTRSHPIRVPGTGSKKAMVIAVFDDIEVP